jgi:mannose-6-phosphate isomerase-like protein (cupin superfamily)
MHIVKLNHCPEFTAGDNTRLREILHPDKADLALRYSFAHAELDPDKSSYPHSLSTSEIYFILEGKGEMFIDNESSILEPGDTVYIPPNAKQYITNIGTTTLKFVCIVDPAWREEDETIHSELIKPQ